jgi:hypothetical protein
MRFSELKKQVKSIGLGELRKESDNYLEAVVLKDNIDELVRKLNNFFGDPVWPSWGKLSLQTERAIKVHGGIIKGQTLYFSKLDGVVIFAMLWPWADGRNITVKIVKQ